MATTLVLGEVVDDDGAEDQLTIRTTIRLASDADGPPRRWNGHAAVHDVFLDLFAAGKRRLDADYRGPD